MISNRLTTIGRYYHCFQTSIHIFPLWLRNRLLYGGLEPPVFNQTEKSRIASNCRQLFTNIEIEIIKLIPVFQFIIFHFDILGNMSLIRCDKYILRFKLNQLRN